MPPPMPNPSKRMTAQPSRPVARYRPGKPTAEEESSDEEESEDEPQQKPQTKVRTRLQPPRAPAQAQHADDGDDDDEGFVTDPEDEEDGGVQIAAVKAAAPATHSMTGHITSIPLEDEDSADGSSEEASESAQSSSSEDEPQRRFQRPIFLKKTDRNTSNTPTTTTLPSTSPRTTSSEHSRRIAETDTLIADKIQRDARARAAGKKAWDDDDDLAPESQVDDTDNLDPAAEHQAWRLRELTRLKRDREAMIARETEIEELERRRNLTAEDREKEDKQFLSKQKEDRDEGRGQSGYLARYHHKGAFFQDDDAAEVLKRRDIMGAKFVDDVSDKSALPEYMRIRDMTKLGKKGRTRYKDLRSEDTGRWGDEVKRWRGREIRRGGEARRWISGAWMNGSCLIARGRGVGRVCPGRMRVRWVRGGRDIETARDHGHERKQERRPGHPPEKMVETPNHTDLAGGRTRDHHHAHIHHLREGNAAHLQDPGALKGKTTGVSGGGSLMLYDQIATASSTGNSVMRTGRSWTGFLNFELSQFSFHRTIPMCGRGIK